MNGGWVTVPGLQETYQDILKLESIGCKRFARYDGPGDPVRIDLLEETRDGDLARV